MKSGRGTYKINKEELGKMLLERKTDRQIGERFKISPLSANRWRNKYYKEFGELTPKRIEQMQVKFVTDVIKETEIQKQVALSMLLDQSIDVNKRNNANNTLTGIHKKELDVLTRFKVVNPDKLEVAGNLQIGTAQDIFKEIEEKHLEANRPPDDEIEKAIAEIDGKDKA